MTVRQQWMIVGVIIAGLGIGLFGASRVLKDELYPINVGSTAPPFRAKVLGSMAYKSLADYKGQVVLLNVWATYCIPCRDELPSLQKLYKTYGDSGLRLVSVSVDPTAPEDSVRRFLDQFGVTFEALYDPSAEIEKAYQITGVPETFLIGREGTIRKKYFADDWSSAGNRALVAELLGLKAPKQVQSADR